MFLALSPLLVLVAGSLKMAPTRPVSDCLAFLEDGRESQWAHCSVTGELFELAYDPETSWAIERDADDHPFVEKGGESTYIYDLARFVPYKRDRDGRITIREQLAEPAGHKWHDLETFSSGSVEGKVGIPLLGGSVYNSTIYVHHKADAGCRVWWSLPTLIRAALTPGRGGKPRNKLVGRASDSRWKAMCKWAAKLFLPQPRASVPYVQRSKVVHIMIFVF